MTVDVSASTLAVELFYSETKGCAYIAIHVSACSHMCERTLNNPRYIGWINTMTNSDISQYRMHTHVLRRIYRRFLHSLPWKCSRSAPSPFGVAGISPSINVYRYSWMTLFPYIWHTAVLSQGCIRRRWIVGGWRNVRRVWLCIYMCIYERAPLTMYVYVHVFIYVAMHLKPNENNPDI